MIAYTYDHRRLDLLELRAVGVKSTRELEEVIEGYSVGTREAFRKEEVYFFIGFTKTSRPLEVAFTVTEDIDIITRGARVPEVETIINEFCRFCYST